MRSGKSAVQCWAVRITRGWGASRPRARAPGRDRGQGRTVQSICWQWRDDTGQSPASQAAATIYLSTNKHKTPPPRQKKLCRINSSNILVTSSISTSAVWTWMDMHWSDVSGSSLHHPRAPCNRASNEPSRRLREVLQSRRRPLLTLFSTVS